MISNGMENGDLSLIPKKCHIHYVFTIRFVNNNAQQWSLNKLMQEILGEICMFEGTKLKK
jgi:hypothetical protein